MFNNSEKLCQYFRQVMVLTIAVIFTSSALAAPATPSIAWLTPNYAAPAQYTIHWDMWWGENATSWRLLENGVEVHSATLSDNSPNAQSAEVVINKNTGGNFAYVVEICNQNANANPQCSSSNSRTITVTGGVATNQPPVISLQGPSSISLYQGDVFVDPGATASDDNDGAVTVSVSGSVNTSAVGTYTLSYNAVDSASLAATTKIRTVTVSADTVAPVISLNGSSSLTIAVGGAFVDPGATANDNRDGSVAVNTTGSVDTSVAATYTLSYNASDSAGNQATTVIRTITVSEIIDITAPVINLLGASSITLTQNSAFTDLGATAADDVDANVAVTTTGSVDTAVLGTYVLTYDAVDSAGNQAISVVRNITVVASDTGTDNIISSFTQATTDPVNWTTVITLTYQETGLIDLKGAKFIISAYQDFPSVNFICQGLSSAPLSYTFEVDAQSGNNLTILTLDFGDEPSLDTEFGGVGQTCTATVYPGSIANANGDRYPGSAISVSQIILSNQSGGGGTTNPPIAGNDIPPNRVDPVDLVVKGWPSHLAMGTITDNAAANNGELVSSQVDSIFKYAGDGAGNRGLIIEPTVTQQTIAQSRAVETIAAKPIIPTMVVYTANASGGGVASEDITDYDNLVKHYQNLIRISASIQVNKDANHLSPGSIVLNPDLFGEWQKNQDTFFKDAFGSESAWTPVLVRQALKEAIDNDAAYIVTDHTGGTHSLSNLLDLTALKAEVDTALEDTIVGWVQSQNLVIKRVSPDVSFSWVLNLWNPGSANWVHADFTGLQAIWNESSQSVSAFIDLIGAYDDNAYRPDYLTFDKFERDGFSPVGRANYAFGARQWDNYLNYVRQITDSVDIPAMLWQIPGGHMATVTENTGSYDIANNSSSAGTYFMGDENIGTAISNIRSDVRNIALNATVYDGATSVGSLLSQTPDYDWSLSRLRHAAYSNVFAILWGGGSTTAVVPIATNGSGDNGWLKNKVVSYQSNGKIPLYHKSSSSTSQPITSIAPLNSELLSVESVMNNSVFLYETPSSTLVPSNIYKWADFLDALNPMHNQGIAGVKFWLVDSSADEQTNIKYAKVAIAGFLAQSMKETIKFDACDENNWSLNTGDPVDYPLSSSCGQLQQVYGDYGMNPNGSDNPYSCPRNPKMEVTALTHASWYGAPGPLFTAPDSVLEEKGLLVNGSVGRWSFSGPDCSSSTATFDPEKQAYQREECGVYNQQKAGGFVWDGSAGKSLEGCGWWGRGVIQTTGRLNFGKLNHFLGRSHVAPENVNQVVEGVLVEAAPANPLYADLDLCSNPELICSTQEHKEIKWIAGLFFWMNEVQGYNVSSGPYASWNYFEQLKAYVDGGLVGTEFIDDVSGIVNRGCPDASCPVSGAVDGIGDRRDNFVKVLQALGLNPQ